MLAIDLTRTEEMPKELTNVIQLVREPDEEGACAHDDEKAAPRLIDPSLVFLVIGFEGTDSLIVAFFDRGEAVFAIFFFFGKVLLELVIFLLQPS